MSEAKNASLYKQVELKLLDAIRTGIYKNGEKIPTELALCELYNVSRTTIRLALQQLNVVGRIKKIQGKGTFVVKEKIPHHTLAPIMSFPEQMENLGRRSESRVLEAIVVPADSPLAEFLHITPNSPVTKLVRLRMADDEPVYHEITYIPWQVAPGLASDDCTGSLFKLLKEKYGLQVTRSVETLEPVIVEDAIAGVLKIEAGSPCFLIKTVSYIGDDMPIEYSIGIFRSDLSNFIIERRYNPF
jgi:GntR family transcriptional regulator